MCFARAEVSRTVCQRASFGGDDMMRVWKVDRHAARKRMEICSK